MANPIRIAIAGAGGATKATSRVSGRPQRSRLVISRTSSAAMYASRSLIS